MLKVRRSRHGKILENNATGLSRLRFQFKPARYLEVGSDCEEHRILSRARFLFLKTNLVSDEDAQKIDTSKRVLSISLRGRDGRLSFERDKEVSLIPAEEKTNSFDATLKS